MAINRKKTKNYLSFLLAAIFIGGTAMTTENSWSQTTTSTISSPNSNTTSSLTEEQKKLLDIALYQQNYVGFEEQIWKFLPDDTQRANYLIQKLSSGHAIIYWMLAEQYSKHIVASPYQFEDKAQIAFTKELVSIALIMAEQDTNMCADRYAKNALRLLKQKYPSLLDFERRYPFGNKEAFEKAVQFLSLLNNRPNPAWVCYWFGDKDSTDVYGKLMSVSNKEVIYRQAIDRMRNLLY